MQKGDRFPPKKRPFLDAVDLDDGELPAIARIEEHHVVETDQDELPNPNSIRNVTKS